MALIKSDILRASSLAADNAGLEVAAQRIEEVTASGWGRVEVIIADHRVTTIHSTTTDKL